MKYGLINLSAVSKALSSDCADVLSDLKVHRPHMSRDPFSQDASHMIMMITLVILLLLQLMMMIMMLLLMMIVIMMIVMILIIFIMMMML